MQYAFNFGQSPPARPKRPERLFFGLFPDSETANRISRLEHQLHHENHLAGRWLKLERLHVSLHSIGDYTRLRSKFVYAARRAANAVSMRPFEVSFRFAKSFDDRRSMIGGAVNCPLVLLGEGDALFGFHAILGAAMARNGLRAVEHFVPHMTLYYGSELVPVQATEPVRYLVKEFYLIHSERGLTRYNFLGRWPLEG